MIDLVTDAHVCALENTVYYVVYPDNTPASGISAICTVDHASALAASPS